MRADLSEEIFRPMLAVPVDKPFDRDGWIFEEKWDGYRSIAAVRRGSVALLSRNQNFLNSQFPRVTDALARLRKSVVLDGEIAVLDSSGHSSFQKLQNYQTVKQSDVYFCVFDLLHIEGKDLRSLPLRERKEILSTVRLTGPLKLTDYIHTNGTKLFEKARKRGGEGIIAKEMNSPYLSGRRSSYWLKIKTDRRQEAIICGFTEPRGSRQDIGALVLGVMERGELTYIGHTGGGFTMRELTALRKRLEPLEIRTSPFEKRIVTNMPVTWVAPELVCEVKFTGWTSEGHLRHPVYLGLREDKMAGEVVREREAKAPSTKAGKKLVKVSREAGSKTAVFSNLDKIYWPKEKITKGDLIEYYEKVSEFMLPHLKDRPESLHRHPNGIEAPSFYHKNMEGPLPKGTATATFISESTGQEIRYLVCQNKKTLLYMANLGCIEINPWLSRVKNSEKPDFVVIDLDPQGVTFDDVVLAAQTVRQVLEIAKIRSFPKTSGATGLHIYIPLGARYDYGIARRFAQLVAQLAHERLPRLTSLERSPSRRLKHVYLDYLQNSRGQTLAAPYSVRPVPKACVSTPLDWKEVKRGIRPDKFTIHTILKRLADKGDLFKGVLSVKNTIEDSIELLLGASYK